LPNEFLQREEISVDTISKFLKKSFGAPVFSLPRHNLSCQLPTELPADLLSACFVWVRHGGSIIHPLYDGPYAILYQGPCAFTLQVRLPEEIIAMSCLEGAHGCGRHAWQSMQLRQTTGPRRATLVPGMTAMLATAQLGGSAATKRVLFSAPLVSSPLQQK
jgi:hypothetical protein